MAGNWDNGWTFFENSQKENAAATQAIIRQMQRLRGNYLPQNLLRRDAKYRRAQGHSEIEFFKWIFATAIKRDKKTVDLIKLEKDYIENGRAAEYLKDYYDQMTPIKSQYNYAIMYYPRSALIESEPVTESSALLESPEDVERGLTSIVGSPEFAEALLRSETFENNRSFLDALRTEKITAKKKRWDGGIADDGNDFEIDIPDYMRYECPNPYFLVSDFGQIRVRLQENLADAPEFQQQYKILVSPAQFENIITYNEKLQNTDFATHSGLIENGVLPVLRGFVIEAHPMVNDAEAFAYIPGVSVGVADWGCTTKVQNDPNIWTVQTARRQYQYDCKLIQPLTCLKITFKGATANKPIGTVGGATGDDVFDHVRDPKGILSDE